MFKKMPQALMLRAVRQFHTENYEVLRVVEKYHTMRNSAAPVS